MRTKKLIARGSYQLFDFFDFRLYFSSNSFPSSSGSRVNGSLQYMHISTLPSIFVTLLQEGHTTWTVLVDNIPIQKYTTVLAMIKSSPKIINIVITSMDVRKNTPTYITKKPIKIKLNANVRILLILLEYFNPTFFPS
jgi:hypothetical protein